VTEKTSVSITPTISIILPTYNRAAFIDAALRSICAQTSQDWELIVVDDGSTDDTRARIEPWITKLGSRLTYVPRPNGGAYAARNMGLDHAKGEFVAFFDSDDTWLPQHLASCLRAFTVFPVLDWVYAACRSVDVSGKVIEPTTFESNGVPRYFRQAPADVRKGVHHILGPGALAIHLEHGFYCGLQNSMIRRRVFDGYRFWEDYRVVEDVYFLARALARGVEIGYLTDVHVIYLIHEGNSSGSAAGASLASLRRISEESVKALERVRRELTLSTRDRRALERTLARQYFWRLGYASCWQAGQRQDGLRAMREGLRLMPWDLSMIKTYAVSSMRAYFAR
jgi:glycosyltransferase involved in cell wall biosynthesis